VVIGFAYSHVTDYSAIEVIDNLAEKYIKEAHMIILPHVKLTS